MSPKPKGKSSKHEGWIYILRKCNKESRIAKLKGNSLNMHPNLKVGLTGKETLYLRNTNHSCIWKINFH